MAVKTKAKISIIFMIIMALVMQIGLLTVCATTPAADATAEASDGILFDGEPDDTGNSAGEIVFMLVIVGACLFFVVEAIVSWIKKHGKS